MVTRFDILAGVSKSLRGSKCQFGKSNFAEDIYICSYVQIVATSISPIQFYGHSSNSEGENAMMEARWKMFHFAYQISDSEEENVIVCPKCFSKLSIFWGGGG